MGTRRTKISEDICEDRVRAFFSKYGPVEVISIMSKSFIATEDMVLHVTLNWQAFGEISNILMFSGETDVGGGGGAQTISLVFRSIVDTLPRHATPRILSIHRAQGRWQQLQQQYQQYQQYQQQQQQQQYQQ